MNIIMTGKGKFVEIQGTAAGAPFSKTPMEGLISLAKHGIEELVAIQHKLVGDLV